MQTIRKALLATAFTGFAATGAPAVEFALRADDLTSPAAAVAVAGTFNDWSTTATPMTLQGKTWEASVDLSDNRYYYKFVWRDEDGATHWMIDPRHPYLADNGICGANNVLDIVQGKSVPPRHKMEYFFFHRSNVKWAAVAGDFNDWFLGQFPLQSSADRRKWQIWVEIRRPFSYKLIHDGIWGRDLEGSYPEFPDGFGGFNSYRPADSITSPETVTLTETIRAGDASLIDRIHLHNENADYGRAVKLARAVADADELAYGTTHPLRLAALDLEAKIHKRWARLPEAVRCWEAIAAVDRDTSETRKAVWELAGYYTHVARDTERARRLAETAITRMPLGKEFVQLVVRHLEATYKERRSEEVIAEADMWLEALPPPDGRDKQYACQLSELWLYKAFAHKRLGQWDPARQACLKLIEMHPYEDSQNVFRAKDMLRVVDIRRETAK